MTASESDLDDPSRERTCPACGASQQSGPTRWTARCSDCGTWSSELVPEINQATAHTLDEERRMEGLEHLRQENFGTIADRLMELRPLEGARVLDVGCAHGWFLDSLAARGADTLGIEPDVAMAERARARGHEVVELEFPGRVAGRGPFDVIAFNDVLEHIRDPRETVRACAGMLRSGGVLSINIPSARGIAFRAGWMAARLGVEGPWKRLWQYGLPSPHMHYFPPDALARLIGDSGFDVRYVGTLASISHTGLWGRLHSYSRPSPATIAQYSLLWAAVPLLNARRWSDIAHLVAIRR